MTGLVHRLETDRHKYKDCYIPGNRTPDRASSQVRDRQTHYKDCYIPGNRTPDRASSQVRDRQTQV